MKLTISLLLKNTIDLLFFSEYKLYGFPQSVTVKRFDKLWIIGQYQNVTSDCYGVCLYDHGTIIRTGITCHKIILARARLAINKKQKYLSLPDHQLTQILILVLGKLLSSFFQLILETF